MRKRGVLKVLLFLLFVGYFCAANLFSHTHIVNGQKVAHSHPYREGHTHNANEYQLIQDLTHFSFLHHSIDILFQVVEIELQKSNCYYRKDYISPKTQDYSSRGPPFAI
ncbi:MAG: hypothetical protein LBH82_06780 [Bacteroidales bacterium]|jgi:hypothetical protein|nr:hypothetical protein [Bacteroidales bacterium]